MVGTLTAFWPATAARRSRPALPARTELLGQPEEITDQSVHLDHSWAARVELRELVLCRDENLGSSDILPGVLWVWSGERGLIWGKALDSTCEIQQRVDVSLERTGLSIAELT